MTSIGRTWRRITVARWLACALLAIAPATALAQPTISTVVGQAEIVAVAVDESSSTIYYASDRPGAIFKMTGVFGASTLVAGIAGGPIGDGVPASQAAVFPGRNGLAVDTAGNVFFTEPSLHRIRRIDATTGVVTTVAGTGRVNGTDSGGIAGASATFTDLAAPGALAFDPLTSDLFVADEAWDIVYRITSNGHGPITDSNALAFRAVGGDTANVSIYVDFVYYNPFGYAGDNGPAIDAKLNHPRGLAFDSTGNLYIADTGNNVVRRVDTTGTISTIAGTGAPGYAGDGSSSPATSAQLFLPTGVVVDSQGDLFIADTSNQRVRIMDLASGRIANFHGDGVARFGNNSLAFPTGLAPFNSTTVIVVDSQNRSIRALGGDTNVEIAHVGDASDPGYVGDGAPGGDALNRPLSVVFDRAGNMFFSDSGNARVRRRDASTGALTTVAGNGVPGYRGDGGPATQAMLNCPAGLVFGPAGDLFIADPCPSVVRKVSPGSDGLVTGAADETIVTYAGTGVLHGTSDGSGGPANAANLNDPETVAIDATGTLSIGQPNLQEIRHVSPSGVIDLGLRGTGTKAFVFDSQGNFINADDAENDDIECNGQQIFQPSDFRLSPHWGGIAVDPLGRLYLSDDSSLQTVYQFSASSGPVCAATFSSIRLATIAGNGRGAIGYSGDGGPATAATFNQPEGLAIDGAGSLFITDSGNNVIRRAAQPVVAVTLNASSLDFGSQGLQIIGAPIVVTAASSGSKPATFSVSTLTGTNPGDFAILSDGCTGTVVAVGSNCQVSVAFKPTTTGQRSAILQINDDASGSPQMVALVGVGTSVSVSPTSIAFGTQTLAIASAPATVTIGNSTSSPITITSLSFSGANPSDYSIVSDGCTNVGLGAHGSCTFAVVFTPAAVGPSSATLNITSTAADPVPGVGVSGVGVAAAAAATVSPASIAFGPIVVGSSSVAITVTVQSNGTAPLLVTSVTLSGNQPGDFSAGGNTCTGASLPPGQSCSVTVAFTPKEICSSSAVLSFADNAPGSPQGVNLTGIGVGGATTAFQSTVFCTSHAAEPQEVATGPDGAVWFDELGSVIAPPAIGRATAAAGVVSENPNVVQSGWKPFEITFGPDGSYAFVEARGAGFPEWLDIVNPAGTKFQSPINNPGPLAIGPDAGFWLANAEESCGTSPMITDFVPNGPTKSYTPNFAWIPANTGNFNCLEPSSVTTGPDGTAWIGSSNLAIGSAPTPSGFIRVASDGTFVDFTKTDGPPMAAAIGADGNLYALIGAGASCNLEQFNTSGGHALVSLDPSINAVGCKGLVAGPDHRLWMVGQTFTGTSIAYGLVAYEPTTGASTLYQTTAFGANLGAYLTAGADEGIWFNGIPSAVGRFDIGGGPSRAYVSPNILSFLPTLAGLATTTQTVTVRSTGTAPLTIAAVTVTGANPGEFSIINGCQNATLPPNSTCTIRVSSTPTAFGSHSATLVISDSDGFSPQTVRLEEYTVPQPPSVSPGSYSFPATNVGQPGGSETVTLTNNGDRPLRVASAIVEGTNTADFHIITDKCSQSTVAIGGTCTVVVQFAPTAAGARTATLTFTDAANPPTQTMALSGGAQPGGGASCACSKTGLFVPPASVQPSPALTSPSGGTFTLVITGPSNAPTHLAIEKTGTTAPIVNIDIPPNATWNLTQSSMFGFSPDGNRFVVHYQSNGLDNIYLYDLITPTRAPWVSSLPINLNGTTTTPSGSIAFSPHGNYFVATQLQLQTSTEQRVFMFLVSSSGVTQLPNPISEWTPSAPPKETEQDKVLQSARWGFSPDDQTFVMFLDDTSQLGPREELISLPTGTLLQEHESTDPTWYVEFSPCSDALGIVTDNGSTMTATLYSTSVSSSRGALGSVGDLPGDKVPSLVAGPIDFTVQVSDYPIINKLATNTSGAGCAAPGASGTAGGLNAPETFTSPTFTPDGENPPLAATEGDTYTYTFKAISSPDPEFALSFDAPSWLSIDEDKGTVTGKIPVGTTSFSYFVTASNSRDFLNTDRFTVIVTPQALPPVSGGGSSGPYEADDDWFDTADAPAQSPAPPAAQATSLPPPAVLVLPNGRGQIQLPADVTPAVSVFSYTETDAPTGPLGGLIFAGLDFTLNAVDATTGASVGSLVDAPRATILFSAEEMRSAHITDPSRLGMYWWSGTAWVNQMPCAGCVFDPIGHTLTVALSRLGEYALAAVPPPPPVLTIAPATIQATAGTHFGGTIATFPPGDPLDDVNQYGAAVTWGDGQSSPGVVSGPTSGVFTISGGHTWSAVGSYQIGITLFDLGTKATAQGTAIVSSSSQTPPQFTAATPPLTATVGVLYSYAFAASGVPAATFALASGAPTWLSIGATTGVVSGTPPVGTTSFTYTVVASNGVSPTASAGPFVVSVAPAPAAPRFTAATPPLTSTQGVTYSYTFAASGVPAPTFALASGAPPWLSIGATTGVVSGVPPAGTTSFTYTVVASNGVSPNASAGPFVVTVSSPTNKSADLAVALTGPASATKGSTVTYSIRVTNSGPAAAMNGAIVLLVGPNASFVSASPTPFVNIDGLWTWKFAKLDAGQSATYSIRLKLTKPGSVLATAAVGADTHDPKLVNNAALVLTVVK